jgi:DNA-binding transcriptional ArsR family regulator
MAQRRATRTGGGARQRAVVSPTVEIVAAASRPLPERGRGRITDADIALLRAVSPADGRLGPRFAMSPGTKPHPQVEAELRMVLETDRVTVERDFAATHPAGVPAAARLLLDRPGTGLRKLVDQMRALWDAVVEPRWAEILPILEAAAAGEQATAEQGVRVVVSAFAARSQDVAGEPPLRVVRVDEAARLVDPQAAALAVELTALGDLIGPRRAQVLVALGVAPATTSQLADRLHASPAGVSGHLAVLRRTGLVTGRRAGREVLYARTRVGDGLVAAGRSGGTRTR